MFRQISVARILPALLVALVVTTTAGIAPAQAQRAGQCERVFAFGATPVARPEEQNVEKTYQPYEQLPSAQLYQRVKSLLNQPINETWRPYIEARLEEIDKSQWLPWWKLQKIAKGETVPGLRLSERRKARLIEVYNQVASDREKASSTLNRPSDPDVKQAKASWEKANEMIQTWIANKVAISVERIADLNRVLYDEEQVEADRRLAERGNRAIQQERANAGFAMGFGWFNPFIGLAAFARYKELEGLQYGDPSQIMAGVLRTYEIAAGGRDRTEYIASSDVPLAMEELVAWINGHAEEIHPIVLAAQAYRGFVSIHPFRNANGRTGRLLLDWILMSRGYPPALFEEGEFYVAVFGRLDELANPSTGKAIANVADAVARSVQRLNPAVVGNRGDAPSDRH